jgi:hypothetical protein
LYNQRKEKEKKEAFLYVPEKPDHAAEESNVP